MKLLKFLMKIAGALMGLTLFLFIINILQKGSGQRDGRTLDEILGKEAKEATANDLQGLKKSDLMQIFYAAGTPDFMSMEGEYRSEIISAGVLSFAADIFTNKMFGPGSMVGKGFYPENENFGWGFNIFHVIDEAGNSTLVRTRKMETFMGSSELTEGDSMHLDYSTYNDGLVNSMHSELKKINDHLFIGMVHLALAGGALNPTPFLVIGPPTEFKGPDA